MEFPNECDEYEVKLYPLLRDHGKQIDFVVEGMQLGFELLAPHRELVDHRYGFDAMDRLIDLVCLRAQIGVTNVSSFAQYLRLLGLIVDVTNPDVLYATGRRHRAKRVITRVRYDGRSTLLSLKENVNNGQLAWSQHFVTPLADRPMLPNLLQELGTRKLFVRRKWETSFIDRSSVTFVRFVELKNVRWIEVNGQNPDAVIRTVGKLGYGPSCYHAVSDTAFLRDVLGRSDLITVS